MHISMFYGNLYLKRELLGHKLCISCRLLDNVNLLSVGIMPIYSPASGVSELLEFNVLAMPGAGSQCL